MNELIIPKKPAHAHASFVSDACRMDSQPLRHLFGLLMDHTVSVSDDFSKALQPIGSLIALNKETRETEIYNLKLHTFLRQNDEHLGDQSMRGTYVSTEELAAKQVELLDKIRKYLITDEPDQ